VSIRLKNSKYELGLIGYPLGHSLSPRLHQAALQSSQLEGEYRLFPIPPGRELNSKLNELFDKVRSRIIQGLNVTIPYKQTIIPFLDELTSTSEKVNAVNTIYLHDGRIIGDNTDVTGFMLDLDNCQKRIDGFHANNILGRHNHALVLGAGGSARAVVYGLIKAGWDLTLAARRIDQGLNLVHSLQSVKNRNSQLFRVVDFSKSSFEQILDSVTLIVNTTPVGMWPEVDFSPWPENLKFPNNVLVYDLIYNPPVTKLISRAREGGHLAVNGIGMLIEQAALAFEYWTRINLDRKVLWDEIGVEYRQNNGK
jgi:shikimate dehydrogenase